MGMEQTLIILKPDAVKRALMGRIITRFEERGLCVVAAKMMKITPELAAQHYSEHTEKDFYPGLVEFMTSCPVLVMVLEQQKDNAVAICREMMGATFAADSDPGTIRGDLTRGGDKSEWNLIHGSDSPEAAAKEISLFFTDNEIHSWVWGPLPGE
jgi:nucleoside-diphosphate kinase